MTTSLTLVFAATPLKLEFSGNKYLGNGKIEDVVIIPQQPELYSPLEWQAWSEDAAAVVMEMYRDLGFFQAKVEVKTVKTGTSDSSQVDRIQFGIREGKRFVFRQVSIESGEAPMLIQALDLRCTPGREFDRDLIYKDRRDLLRTYGNAGFLHAKAGESWRLDSAVQAVDLVYQVDAGQPLVFDTLLIRNRREGDEDGEPGLTHSILLQNLLQLKRGDTVSLRKTSAYEKKLRSTHVFNQVRLKDSTLDSNSGLTALVLKMEERIPGEMELSGFYETEDGPGFSGSWTHSNLGGRLHEAHALFSMAQRRQNLIFGYASLLLFGSPFRFDNDFSIEWRQISVYAEKRTFFGGDFNIENQSRLSRSLGSHYRYVAGAELSGQSLLKENSLRTRGFDLNWLNSIFSTYLDDLLNPTRGLRSGLTWGNGGPILASGEVNVTQERHNWIEMENAGYWPLWEWLNLAGRVDGGRFLGKADFNAHRFFLGGSRNVRSHGWRQICPELDTNGVCDLAKKIAPAYFLVSAELRMSPFPAFWAFKDNWLHNLPGIQVVPFCDYGAVWEIDQAIKPQGRGVAVGLGLRYVLFNIFNLRLDYAVDPYRTESSGSPVSRWVLDLAQAF